MPMVVDVPNLILQANTDRLGQFLIVLKNALVARGWTVRGSGDGQSAFQNEGQTAGPFDVFTAPQPWVNNGTSLWHQGGANTISRSMAWFRVREPAPSTREFVFQRYNGTVDTGMNWLNRFQLAVDGFTSGGASSTVAPNSPGITTSWNSQLLLSGIATITSNVLTVHIWISDQARAGNVWPFYVMCYDNTLSSQQGGIVYESLIETAASDTRAWVLRAGATTITQGTSAVAPTTSWVAVRSSGVLDASTRVYGYSGGFATPSATIPQNSPDGKIRALQVLSWTNDNAWKGVLEHIRWNPNVRNYPHTVDLATTTPRLHWGAFLMPWKQNETPGT